MRGAWILAAIACLTACAPAAADDEDDQAVASEEAVEPVDLNRADLEDLLAIPGMDADLARALLNAREKLGRVDSLEALYREPSITPARLLSLSPWLTVEPRRSTLPFETWTSMRSATASQPVRVDVKSLAGFGPVGAALRIRKTLGAEPGEGIASASARIEARVFRSIRITVGDQAPVRDFGLLVGVSNRPPPVGARDPIEPSERSKRVSLPPAIGGRRLTGAQIEAGGFRAGAFRYDAGPTGSSSEEEPIEKPAVLLLGGSVGGRVRLGASSMVYQGRIIEGLALGLHQAGTSWTIEVVRDPSNRWRSVFGATTTAPGPFHAVFSAAGGSRRFVNPLGVDSERAPLSPGNLESGRNENRSETSLWVRYRVKRGLALEGEVRGAVEGATLRRAFERPVGYGRAALDVSLGAGWSAVLETRLENRGSKGPSSAAEAPLRRHTGIARLGWERHRSHLRFEWRGRLDIETPPDYSTPPTVANVQDVVAVRGKWQATKALSLAGGVARFRTPSASPATLYEERPAGLNPAVSLRGLGRRGHVAVEFRPGGGLRIGAFGGASLDASGETSTTWGVEFQLSGSGG